MNKARGGKLLTLANTYARTAIMFSTPITVV
jgi:hypothetical protein